MIRFLLVLLSLSVFADNEVYVNQVGNSATIDLEQIGSSNLIGGTSATSGSMTALDLDGVSMTLDINQIGSSNIFRSDGIDADDFTGFFEFDGDSNVMDILVNSSGTLDASYGDFNVDVTGSSNTFDLKVAESSNSSYLNLDWIITGDSNTFDFDIDYENATNYVDVNGSTNDITFSGSGYSGTTSSDSGYFYLDLDGSSNTIDITQASTLARDYIKLETTTSNSNICIIQNDGGTTTTC
jgi:hypothetical protein